MSRFEYKVIPAPRKGRKARGAKSPEDRFANALASTLNAEALEGWEYVRTDTLPTRERKGLTGSTTVYQNMLVFKRVVGDAEASLLPPQVPELAVLPPHRTPPPLGPARSDAPPAPEVQPSFSATEPADDSVPESHDHPDGSPQTTPKS